MAIIKLSERKFSLVSEGKHIFKVVEVNDEKYEDYGKIDVKLQTEKGETHIERFSLLKSTGEMNDGALKAWSYFVRNCLNNTYVDEIDTQDIVGCYIQATVKHDTYTRTKGEKAGTNATIVRLNDYAAAKGFESSEEPMSADEVDGFLDD